MANLNEAYETLVQQQAKEIAQLKKEIKDLKKIPKGSSLVKCYVKSCEQEYISDTMMFLRTHGRGENICPNCYPIWSQGVKEERDQWEDWTGETREEHLFHHNC